MKRENIGGQAVLEGVMLRGLYRQAVAVRSTSGEIVTQVISLMPLAHRWPILGFPLLRGIVALYESLKGAVSSLAVSASLLEPTEELTPLQLTLAVTASLVLGIGLFFLLPAILVSPLERHLSMPGFLLNLSEGVVRILLFIGYLLLVGLMKDIKRTFEYHGAEHKVIACWEGNMPLTPASAATCSRFHPRCGTGFLLLVVVLSIFLFSFFSPANLWVKLGLRLALLPVLAGISYELVKWTARGNSPSKKALAAPGLMLQRLTTREPDLAQLEVALAALAGVVDPKDQ